MRQGGSHVLDLVCALATNLPRRFHDCEQPVHAGMAIGQPAAVGVDRQLATRTDAPIRHEPSALALWTEAQILKEEERVAGGGVVGLHHAAAIGREAWRERGWQTVEIWEDDVG